MQLVENLLEQVRLNEELYDTIFRACVGLSNAHIMDHPLCDTDEECYIRRVNKMVTIGEDIARKRKLTQVKYRSKQRLRLSTSINDVGGEE